MRTCVGCRDRRPADELLRIVAVDGVVLPDPSRRLAGRGAHLHPSTACLDKAVRRRAFSRALRAPAGDISELARYLDRSAVSIGARAAGAGAEQGLDSAEDTDAT